MKHQDLRDTCLAAVIAATVGIAAIAYRVTVSWATSLRDDYCRAKREHPAAVSVKSPRVFTVHEPADHA